MKMPATAPRGEPIRITGTTPETAVTVLEAAADEIIDYYLFGANEDAELQTVTFLLGVAAAQTTNLANHAISYSLAASQGLQILGPGLRIAGASGTATQVRAYASVDSGDVRVCVTANAATEPS